MNLINQINNYSNINTTYRFHLLNLFSKLLQFFILIPIVIFKGRTIKGFFWKLASMDALWLCIFRTTDTSMLSNVSLSKYVKVFFIIGIFPSVTIRKLVIIYNLSWFTYGACLAFILIQVRRAIIIANDIAPLKNLGAATTTYSCTSRYSSWPRQFTVSQWTVLTSVKIHSDPQIINTFLYNII